MEIRVCKGCKKMFQYIAGPTICPKCKQVEEEHFQVVKEYLRENPGESLIEVSKQTQVEVGLIEKFLRQGRLEVAPDSPIALTCEMCGKRITTGKYCANCKRELSNELNEVKRTMIAPENLNNSGDQKAKMRFLKKDSF